MRNPTPLLRKLRHQAYMSIRDHGKKGALEVHRMVNRHYEIGSKNYREQVLTLRMIAKAQARKRTVRKSMLDKLLEDHGTADASSVRGFILEDGSCLNLGQYDDHRIICGVYPNSRKAEERYGSRYGAMKHLCIKFNMIRWMPERGYVEVFVPTTRHQDETMRDLADAGLLKEAEVHAPRQGTVMLEARDGETLVQGINALYG
jgi:hypothetical protein